MIFRYPSYYDEFECIADRCEHTCCAGWEIDIDDKSYEYYRSVPGAFGERLNKNIQTYECEDEPLYEQHGFLIDSNLRCPFLDEHGLCEIYRELGEAALCDVCADTPRNYFEYGGQREVAISAACPEAARLIYQSEEKTTFVEQEIDETLDFVESGDEIALAALIRQAREHAIELLQDREQDISCRIRKFLEFACEVQAKINQTPAPEPVTKPHTMTPYQLFLSRMVSFSRLESISVEWEQRLADINETIVECEEGEERYRQLHSRFREELEQRNRIYEYEHLLVYYAFMCLPRCMDDYDFIGKAKLVVTSYLFIRDMDAVCFFKKGEFTTKDRIDSVRIYAREIEHSQHNMDDLAEDFIFDEAYEPGNLSWAASLV